MSISLGSRHGGAGPSSNNDNEAVPDGPSPTANAAGNVAPDLEHAHNLFEAHRGYIVHEDELVNQRTTWSITIQAFAIAIFGLTFQKKIEVVTAFYGLSDKPIAITAQTAEKLLDQFDQFMVMVSAFGLAVAAISGVAVYAAQRSIQIVEGRWRAECSGNHACRHFPPMTGGGSGASTALGHVFPLLLPVFLILFWSFVVGYVYLVQKDLLGNLPPVPH